MSNYDIKELKLKISKAKMTLFNKGKGTTFFSALLSSLRIEINETISTASIDGITMRFNPYFIAPLSNAQFLGLMMHELGHVIYDHIGRRLAGKMEQTIWNIAGDHYINLWLLRLGFELPEGGVWDTKYANWSTMQIYKDLMKNPPPKWETFKLDIMGRPANMDETTHRERINSNILKAVDLAISRKDQGSIPADVLRLIEDITKPTLPWQTILQNHMNGYAKEDYSWSRPNRRYMPAGFYLPHRHSEGLNQITCGDDVSGSMSQDDLNAIFNEQKYIWETLKPIRMRVQTFDTHVHMDKIFVEGDTLDGLQLKGGGGTNVQPLIESIKKELPEVALIFTDGHFSKPDMSGTEATDIFWIIKDNKGFDNPHGTVIHF
jgi:predicted metal-dependent peptidase